MQTDRSYQEWKIIVNADLHDLLIAELMDLGFDGFDQYDDHFLAYIPSSQSDDEIRQRMEAIVDALQIDVRIDSMSKIEPQNWNEEWEKTIQPMEVGAFFVRPTWSAVPTPDGLSLLLIDPKMAFGTGYHETTRCMLRMLKGTVKGGESVLDVGTGTGILAIAALKLGASEAFGFDIDEWSSVNATENAINNDVAATFKVEEGSFETVPVSHYDLVLANVNRNMLIETAPIITSYVQEGGVLLLSGLLETDEADILSVPEYASLKLEERLQENEWICLKFVKD